MNGLGLRLGRGGAAVGGGSGSRYVRLFFSYGQIGGQNISLSEIDFQDSEDESIDVSGGTWTASSVASSNVASNVADGNTATDWLSGTGSVQWIQYDAGAGEAINPAKIGFSAGETIRWPTYIEVTTSDDAVTFTTSHVIVPPSASTRGETHVYATPGAASLTAQHWAILTKANNGGSITTLAEVEFLASSVDQTGSGTAFANKTDYGAGSNAFDDDAGTITGNASTSQFLVGYDLGSAIAIDQYSMTAQSANGTNSPAEGFCLSSTDGLVYSIADTFTQSLANGEKITHTL